MRARILMVAALLLCLLAWPASAWAAPDAGGKIDDSVEAVLRVVGNDQAIPVIVFAPDDPQVVAEALPAAAETTELELVDGVAACLTGAEIAGLATDADVEGIVADNPMFGVGAPATMSVTNATIGLGELTPPTQGGPDGDGVTVAVLDSGVAATPDLTAARIVGWKDFVNRRKAPYDDAGHGTFVAGLIAGDGSASLPVDQGGPATTQYRGVAPAADIVGIKVLDETGQGRASGVIAGIAWAIKQRDRLGIDVLNVSIGGNPTGPVATDPVAMAVEIAWRKGIVVVCAAGNEGEFGLGGIVSPGNAPSAITVGATDTRQTPDLADDAVASYSSMGPTLYDEYAKPDVVAPGNRLVSLRVPGSYIDREFPQNLIPVSSYVPGAPADAEPSYLMLSGTSTSAPVVAGAAALMLGEDASLSPDDVKTRLMRTADPVAGATRHQQGAGLIDVDEALADTSHATGPALSEDLGNGTTVLSAAVYPAWDTYVWQKYGWTKFKWTKFKWTKFKWTKFKWTGEWTKFKWTKFKWTDYSGTKFKWTTYGWTKFKWTSSDWTKFKWTVLIEGQ